MWSNPTYSGPSFEGKMVSSSGVESGIMDGAMVLCAGLDKIAEME